VKTPTSDYVGAIARFTAAGVLDTTFAPGGALTGMRIVRTSAPAATNSTVNSVAIARDGHVLVTGSQYEGGATRLLVGRYTDGGVGAGGFTGPSTLDVPGSLTAAGMSIVALAHGKAVLAGTSDESGEINTITIRLGADGTPDPAWGDQAGHPGLMEVSIGQGD